LSVGRVIRGLLWGKPGNPGAIKRMTVNARRADRHRSRSELLLSADCVEKLNVARVGGG
jgi:hypothetical protein